MKCISEKWAEVFVLNDITFEEMPGSYKSKYKDIPIYIARNVLKYPEQVREFMENGYWWTNGGAQMRAEGSTRPGKSFDFGQKLEDYFSPLINKLQKFYDVDEVVPIEVYGNCYNSDMDLYNIVSAFPHVDTYPGDNQNENPLHDYAFNINLTKSDKVKTGFYSFNNKKSVCHFTRNDYNDLKSCWVKQKQIIKDKKWFFMEDNFENYKMEYVADIEYNSMILYPSHYWHNAYMKEDWFTDTDRITLTGFFEICH